MTDTTNPIKWIWHNSMLGTISTCEQKAKYSYIDGLKRPEGSVSIPMLRGSWFHALMAAQGLKQGLAQDTLLIIPTVVDLGHDRLNDVSLVYRDDGYVFITNDDREYTVDPASVHQMWKDHVSQFMPTGDEKWDALPDEVWFLYRRYIAIYGPILMTERVLLVEHQWQRTETSSGLTYGGRVDRVVGSQDGRVIIRDHKTAAMAPSADARLTASQLHLYAWGLAPLLDEFDLTPQAIEFEYIITRKPGSVRLTKAGNLYKNMGVTDEHALVEGLRALELDPDDAKWEDARAEAREVGNPTFFHRALMPVNETVVAALLGQGQSAAETMVNLSEGAVPLRATGRHCEWCQFQKVCTGDLYGNDTSPLRAEFGVRDVSTVEVF
jgi:hypothetical protein